MTASSESSSQSLTSPSENEWESADSSFLDEVASQIDSNEAAKICVLAESFQLSSFQNFQKSVIDAIL